jgi:hypothetical protein
LIDQQPAMLLLQAYIPTSLIFFPSLFSFEANSGTNGKIDVGQQRILLLPPIHPPNKHVSAGEKERTGKNSKNE